MHYSALQLLSHRNKSTGDHFCILLKQIMNYIIHKHSLIGGRAGFETNTRTIGQYIQSVHTLCTLKVSEKSFHFSSAAIITGLPLPTSFPSLPSTPFLELLAGLWPMEVGEHPAALCSLTVQTETLPSFLEGI